ncbi:MAG TPA: hypothetical protein VI837_00320, partial [Blastocatellia bacterium]|nr:hypothetical protein [Blastocatellia bacterium]
EDLRRFILSDVFWKSSDDVQVETTKLELSLAEVFAGHGSEKDTYYSANGLELRISCVAHVAEQAPPGLRQIFAEAPGLARASTALGALAVFEKRYLLSSGTTIKVKDLYIHGSQFSKITSLIAGNWKGIVALLMIVALIASGIRKVFA